MQINQKKVKGHNSEEENSGCLFHCVNRWEEKVIIWSLLLIVKCGVNSSFCSSFRPPQRFFCGSNSQRRYFHCMAGIRIKMHFKGLIHKFVWLGTFDLHLCWTLFGPEPRLPCDYCIPGVGDVTKQLKSHKDVNADANHKPSFTVSRAQVIYSMWGWRHLIGITNNKQMVAFFFFLLSLLLHVFFYVKCEEANET